MRARELAIMALFVLSLFGLLWVGAQADGVDVMVRLEHLIGG